MLLVWFPTATASQVGTFPAPIVEQESLRIAAATDWEAREPWIVGFQQLHPEIAVDSVDTNMNEV
jgi:hypothetical protein